MSDAEEERIDSFDSDEETLNSVDSDSFDEWQDFYTTDHEDKPLDDDNLPPVIIDEKKYKPEKCLLCFKDLDTEIGSPDVCAHMFCLKCINLWAELSETCPEDGREFTRIMKFVRRENKITYQHEKGINISCGKSDLGPQNPQKTLSSMKFKKSNNLPPWYPDGTPPEPLWRFRNKKCELPAGRRIKERNPFMSDIFEFPSAKRVHEGRSRNLDTLKGKIQQEAQAQELAFIQIPMPLMPVGEGVPEFGNRIDCQRRYSQNNKMPERDPILCNIPQHSPPSIDLKEDVFDFYLPSFFPRNNRKNCNLRNAQSLEDLSRENPFYSSFPIENQNFLLRGYMKDPFSPVLLSEVD